MLDQAADRRVLDAAAHVQELWLRTNQSAALVRPLMYSLGGDGRRYEIAIYDRNGSEVIATTPGQIEPVANAPHATMQTLIVGDEASRCAISKSTSSGLSAYTVVVCDASSYRTNQSVAVFRHILVPQSLILLIATGLVWYGLRYILRPLVRLQSDLDARDMNHLTPVNVSIAPRELEPLLSAVNNLMSRLSVGFESQRRFIANAAHQLRTPLAAIHTRIELAHRMLQNGEVKGAQEVLSAQAQLSVRTTKLANQLLSLARSETAGLSGHEKPLVVAQALANALARSAARAQTLSVELIYETIGATDRWRIAGDQTLIEEAISNVLENAITHAPARTEVRCIADATAREIRILDVGPGLPDVHAQSMFEPFVRGADAQHVGTGLGLAIVREIMRRHGGDAHFAPRNLGEGACMILTFPTLMS